MGGESITSILSVKLRCRQSWLLPYISSFTSCEVIILTEEKFFPQFEDASAVRKIREICPVRLISLDDLISKKDKYGMALT
jgi:hypothetical protein